MFVLLFPSIALAELPSKMPDEEPTRPGLMVIAAPCLQPKQERQYVVSWWIENPKTGERRAVGSQDVRLRC